MTRFVTGEEITEVSGAIAETFIKQRKRMTGTGAGGIAAGLKSGEETGPVTVDDTVLFLARFSGGAVASFEAAGKPQAIRTATASRSTAARAR